MPRFIKSLFTKVEYSLLYTGWRILLPGCSPANHIASTVKQVILIVVVYTLGNKLWNGCE